MNDELIVGGIPMGGNWHSCGPALSLPTQEDVGTHTPDQRLIESSSGNYRESEGLGWESREWSSEPEAGGQDFVPLLDTCGLLE